MRLTRLPAALVSALVVAGVAACANTIQGSGTIASDVVTGAPTPDGSSGSSTPAGSDDPTPTPSSGATPSSAATPSSTASTQRLRERALCVQQRGAITGINTSFNSSRRRSQQVQILEQGAATLDGQLSRSKLPADDPIQRAGRAVQTELAQLSAAASAGRSPSTKPYNEATGKFQQACNSIP